jgi:iron complex transport system ATP-binding protein
VLIELVNVSYTAGGCRILDGVNWSVDRGSHWAVLGPNGSGKTTLLKVACGYLWPTGGVVRRLGQELIDLGELRRSIGWISADLVGRIPPREPALLTVVAGRFAQVGFKDLPTMQPTPADYCQAQDLLERLRCGELRDRPFGVLSQGEKQKVLIARARMAEPLLLVLDEPCAGMDPGSRERFLAALESLAQDRTSPAIVLVTHHVEEIMPSLQQTIIIDGGRISAAGPTQKVVTADRLARLYGTPVSRIESCGGRLWPIWN